MSSWNFQAVLNDARAGERQALDQLFEHFYERVQRMVHASLSSGLRSKRPWLVARFSTGDVVQEVFKSVLRDLNGFGGSGEEAFAGYLSVVVRNRILDAVRHHEAAQRDVRKSGANPDFVPDPGQDRDPAKVAEEQDQLRRYREAIETFPERERILLRARFEGSETLAELTEMLVYPSLATTRRTFLAAKARLAVLMNQDRPLEHQGSDAPGDGE